MATDRYALMLSQQGSVISYEAGSSEEIAGVRVDPVSMEEAVEAVVESARTRLPRGDYVTLTNAYSVVESQRSPELKDAIERSFLSVPDGSPLVWMMRHRGYSSCEKVTGIEYIPPVARAGLEHGLRHFFFGGAPGVAEAAAKKLTELVPGTQIAGTYCPPFDPNGEWDLNEINNLLVTTQANIMWVGVGAPKQELWMAKVSGRIQVPVMLGVGAAFDFLAGTKPAAPRFMSRLGLEWLFRLLSEPRRLWKRYLVGNSKFIGLSLKDLAASSKDEERRAA